MPGERFAEYLRHQGIAKRMRMDAIVRQIDAEHPRVIEHPAVVVHGDGPVLRGNGAQAAIDGGDLRVLTLGKSRTADQLGSPDGQQRANRQRNLRMRASAAMVLMFSQMVSGMDSLN